MKMIHHFFCAAAVLLGAFSQSASGAPATIKANDDAVSITSLSLPITLDHLTDNDTSTGSIFIFNASQPSSGAVQLKPNNVIVYTPSSKFSGTDTFTYSISSSANGVGAISTAFVSAEFNSSEPANVPCAETIFRSICAGNIHAS